MAGHFIGKFVFSRLLNVKIADVEYQDETKKCIVIPIQDNDVQQWNGEWEMWFRAFAYRNPKGKFSHFLMKYIGINDIKKLSQAQVEAFSRHHMGGMMKSSYEEENKKKESVQELEI